MDLLAFLIFIGSWLILCTGIYGLFIIAGSTVDVPTKRAVGTWLQNIKLDQELPNWPQTFAVLFDRVFTEKHWSWKCFGRSSITSIASLGILSIIFLVVYPDLLQLPWLETLKLSTLFVLIINIIPDFLSLFQSRYLLSKFANIKKARHIALLIAIDFSLTGIIFFVVGGLLFGRFLVELTDHMMWLDYLPSSWDLPSSWENIFSWIEIYFSGVLFRPEEIYGVSDRFYLQSEGIYALYSIFLYSTYFTSIWLWLYAGSAFLLKLIAIPHKGLIFLQRHLDIAGRPFRAMGFTLLLLISIAYLAWGVVLVAR